MITYNAEINACKAISACGNGNRMARLSFGSACEKGKGRMRLHFSHVLYQVRTQEFSLLRSVCARRGRFGAWHGGCRCQHDHVQCSNQCVREMGCLGCALPHARRVTWQCGLLGCRIGEAANPGLGGEPACPACSVEDVQRRVGKSTICTLCDTRLADSRGSILAYECVPCAAWVCSRCEGDSGVVVVPQRSVESDIAQEPPCSRPVVAGSSSSSSIIVP